MGVFGCQFIVRLVQERSNLVAKWRRTNIAAGYNQHTKCSGAGYNRQHVITWLWVVDRD